jgi:8-amino-7-oxononanoate synthase
MDGDILPMDELLAILDRHQDIFLYLDEAHATGLLGPNGFGLSSRLNQSNVGAYVAMGKIITIQFFS